MAKKRKPTLSVHPKNFDNDKYMCVRVYERPDGLSAIVMMSKHASPPHFMVMSGRSEMFYFSMSDAIKACEDRGYILANKP